MILKDFLQSKEIEHLDAELLAAHVLKQDRSFVLAHPEYRLSIAQERKLRSLIKRRKAHEPLAYILGEKEFFGLPFFVNKHTLIPRPETELLVEQTLARITRCESRGAKKKVVVVDIGTGSGCIAISILKNLPAASIDRPASTSFFAVDISVGALRVARRNARRHGVEKKIVFVKSGLLKGIARRLERYDTIIVVANLPYLSSTLYRSTAPGVQRFEPKSALWSAHEGLAHYRRLMREMKLLAKGAPVHFLLEISPEQRSPLQKIYPSDSRVFRDLAGRSRVFSGTFHISA